MLFDILLDLLQHSAVRCGGLESRDSFLVELLDDFPAASCGKLLARLPLHGNVILVQLLDSRYPLQAIDSIHCILLLR